MILDSDIEIDTSMPYTISSPLAATRSNPTRVRVRDADETNYDYVYGESTNFKIIGELTLDTPSLDDTWKVGATDKIVDWSYKGDLEDVKIYISYDGSDPDGLLTTESASDGLWTWSTGVPNEVSSTVKVKVTAADAETDTYVVSDTFLIVGGFLSLIHI